MIFWGGEKEMKMIFDFIIGRYYFGFLFLIWKLILKVKLIRKGILVMYNGILK